MINWYDEGYMMNDRPIQDILNDFYFIEKHTGIIWTDGGNHGVFNAKKCKEDLEEELEDLCYHLNELKWEIVNQVGEINKLKKENSSLRNQLNIYKDCFKVIDELRK